MFAWNKRAALEHARGFAGHPDPWLRPVARLIAGQLLINMGEAADAEREYMLALTG